MPPTTLDATKRGQACELAALGLSRLEVARRLGCSQRTLLRARRRNPEFDRLYRDAEAATLAKPLEHLRRHAKTSWRAAAWLLERTEPQEFAARRSVRFRPREFDDAARQIVEAALQETTNPEQRSKLYGRLTEVVEAVGEALLQPEAAASRAALRRPTPLADAESLFHDSRREFDPLSALTGHNPTRSGHESDTSQPPRDNWRTHAGAMFDEIRRKSAEIPGAPTHGPLSDVSIPSKKWTHGPRDAGGAKESSPQNPASSQKPEGEGAR